MHVIVGLALFTLYLLIFLHKRPREDDYLGFIFCKEGKKILFANLANQYQITSCSFNTVQKQASLTNLARYSWIQRERTISIFVANYDKQARDIITYYCSFFIHTNKNSINIDRFIEILLIFNSVANSQTRICIIGLHV